MVHDLLPKDGLILCAVSGGADSVYLLLRLRELGYRVAAAHYNHGLRGRLADRDEQFVKNLCDGFGIAFYSGRGDVSARAKEHRLGIEEAARALRYAFLEKTADDVNASVIATAHTADDNTETVLMHMIRGTGLNGLCGIPPKRGRIVRPILDESHADALKWLCVHGIAHMEDETNASPLMTRNRLRQSVIPLLRKENPSLYDAVYRMTASLREDEAYLDSLAQAFIREHVKDSSADAKALSSLPRPVAARVIRRLVGAEISAKQTEAVLSVAARGGFADISGMRVGVSGGRLVCGVTDAPSLPDRVLSPGARLALPEAGMTVTCEIVPEITEDVHKSFNTFFFKYANICGNMTVGARRPGDFLRISHRKVTKTLKQLFPEAAIPVWQRGSVPVLRDGYGVLGVYGLGAAARAEASPGDENVIKIEFIPIQPEEHHA